MKNEATLKSESKRPRKKKFAAIFYKPIPEEKELAELMEKRSQCVSESSSILSKKKKIKSRLVSIEWKLHAAHAKPQETRSAFCWYSILEGSNLTKLIQEQSQEIMIPKRAEKACKFLLDALECIEEKASSDVERIMKLLNSTYCKTGKTFWDKMREMMEIVFEEACWRLPRTLEGSILNWAIHASIDHTLNQHTFAEVVADPKWAQKHEFIQIPENETGSLVTYKALKGEVVVRKD